ncbi:hypothetical protein GH714_010804 [Hevea brasiliensis]|uniref:Cation/H+ exchanger domain-containing protein n=1 Tax=Hevea brasiliensis TaxID=3981 RepID=A0A6A6MHZ5_HEVBR|nr:hypothetical protein GH714_010804 [Hevea brasiliensis]
MELSERTSAILMVHKARKNGLPFWNKLRQSDSNQVVVAFEAFRQLNRVFIRPMTAISAMHDMHEDICTSAERKRAAMIILPFHKHQRLDGTLETTRNEFRWVNKRVLEHSPCSVGILVDRGFGGGTHVSASNVSSTVTVLFFGGHDDREALAYGARMAEHPGISLIIVHFIPSNDIMGQMVKVDITDESKRPVNSAKEIVEIVKEFSRCNLFVVGRMPVGPVAAALTEKAEYPELGPVGNLLTSNGFTTSASVLVVQQYNGSTTSQLSSSSSTKIVELPEDDSETG